MRSSTVVFSIGFLLAAAPAFASKAKKAHAPAKEAAAEEAPAEEAAAPRQEPKGPDRAFKAIQWTRARPRSASTTTPRSRCGGLRVHRRFGRAEAARAHAQPDQRHRAGHPDGREARNVLLFEFEDIGYVKDADKEKLDGDDILKSLRAGNEETNKARKERGWAPITITGWHTPPFYNSQTNNLEWCIQGESRGHTIVNYNTRILGRHGVMSANLMVDPEQLGAMLPVAKKLLAGFSYVEGKKYSQSLPGDKVAKYGLTALVVGGAVGIAAKTGLLAKIALGLGKLWKALILGLVGIGVAIDKFLFGHKSERPAAPPPAMDHRRRPPGSRRSGMGELAELYAVFGADYLFECGDIRAPARAGPVPRLGSWRARRTFARNGAGGAGWCSACAASAGPHAGDRTRAADCRAGRHRPRQRRRGALRPVGRGARRRG